MPAALMPLAYCSSLMPSQSDTVCSSLVNGCRSCLCQHLCVVNPCLPPCIHRPALGSRAHAPLPPASAALPPAALPPRPWPHHDELVLVLECPLAPPLQLRLNGCLIRGRQAAGILASPARLPCFRCSGAQCDNTCTAPPCFASYSPPRGHPLARRHSHSQRRACRVRHILWVPVPPRLAPQAVRHTRQVGIGPQQCRCPSP